MEPDSIVPQWDPAEEFVGPKATSPDLSQWKIPPRAVPSDDCAVTIGRKMENGQLTDQGTAYYPHEGETAWVLPIGTMQAYLEMAKFEDLSVKAQGMAGLKQLDDKLVDLCKALSKVIVAWDWTDNARQPLPQPYHNPDVLHGLEVDELLWLCGAAQGEAPSERKNGSGPSRATRRAQARSRQK